MANLANNRTARRGRVFPERKLSREEIARLEAEDEVFAKRCHVIFDRVQPDLIKEHYDWFIIIEPDSGDYKKNAENSVALAQR